LRTLGSLLPRRQLLPLTCPPRRDFLLSSDFVLQNAATPRTPVASHLLRPRQVEGGQVAMGSSRIVTALSSTSMPRRRNPLSPLHLTSGREVVVCARVCRGPAGVGLHGVVAEDDGGQSGRVTRMTHRPTVKTSINSIGLNPCLTFCAIFRPFAHELTRRVSCQRGVQGWRRGNAQVIKWRVATRRRAAICSMLLLHRLAPSTQTCPMSARIIQPST